MITAGVDVGTRFLKIVIVEFDELIGYSCNEMNSNFDELYKDSLKQALYRAYDYTGKKIKKGNIKKIISTGYGSELIQKGKNSVTDSICIAKAASTLESIKTVIDIGGLFIRIVVIDENGLAVEDYLNDKCASGSGKFLEMVSEALEIPFEKISEEAKKSVSPYHITNSCAVFAESDVISQVNAGRDCRDILSGVLGSIASKVVSLLSHSDAPEKILITGGMSKIPFFVELLEEHLNKDLLITTIDTQIFSAYGAALIGQDDLSGSGKG